METIKKLRNFWRAMVDEYRYQVGIQYLESVNKNFKENKKDKQKYQK